MTETMTKTMTTALVSRYGGNDAVELASVAIPAPGPGEVLVKVQAAGVNPIDWKIRDGAGERLGLSLPILLGGELVGTVDAIGPGVDRLAEGERVFGMVRSGAFSDYALAKAADMVPAPERLDVLQAAALPLAGTTAWQALFDEAKLEAGQRLLITNSSGGVGSLAVQLAKARGAHVTAVTSARNADFVRSLGADEIIDYTSQRFDAAANGMDVVLDTLGGDSFQRGFATLRPGGILVTVVAFPEGEAERFGVRATRSFTRPNAQSLAAIRDLADAGRLTPHVERVFPLSEIRDALTLSQGGHARGKIILSVSG